MNYEFIVNLHSAGFWKFSLAKKRNEKKSIKINEKARVYFYKIYLLFSISDNGKECTLLLSQLDLLKLTDVLYS